MLIDSLIALALIVGSQLGPQQSAQPEQPEALPAGAVRTTDGSLQLSSLPTYEPALAVAAKVTKALSISSLSFGDEGRLAGFAARYWGEQPLPVGTSFSSSSVTVDANGIILAVEFGDDSGCDMTVTIDGGHVTYSCDVTTCATVCDTVLSGPSGGPYTVECECRADPE